MAANVAAEWLPPTLYCHPKEMVEVIDRLCLDEALRTRLGDEARAFVRRQRNRREVARRFLSVARNEIPADWWFDPLKIEYVHGLGEEQHIRRLIRGTVDHGGVSALQLDDSPDVRTRMLAFAGIVVAHGVGGNRPSTTHLEVGTPATSDLTYSKRDAATG